MVVGYTLYLRPVGNSLPEVKLLHSGGCADFKASLTKEWCEAKGCTSDEIATDLRNRKSARETRQRNPLILVSGNFGDDNPIKRIRLSAMQYPAGQLIVTFLVPEKA
jgi:hypothetical protein